jgi:hypothetical protein
MYLIDGSQETENQIVNTHSYVEDLSKDRQRFELNWRKAFCEPSKNMEEK